MPYLSPPLPIGAFQAARPLVVTELAEKAPENDPPTTSQPAWTHRAYTSPSTPAHAVGPSGCTAEAPAFAGLATHEKIRFTVMAPLELAAAAGAEMKEPPT